MEIKKKSPGISAAWKKDDWMAIWIGFIILAVFIAGLTFKPPSFKWMSDITFTNRAKGMVSKVESLSKDARIKGESALAERTSALDTRFKELFTMGRGKPATAFLIAQGFNIGWTLLIAFLIFGGVLFAVPNY